MTTPANRNPWENLLHSRPILPAGIPAPDDSNFDVDIPDDDRRALTEAIAAQVYDGIVLSDIPRNPSLHVMPSNGQELWISQVPKENTPDTFTFQRVPQIIQIHGPEWRVTTTERLRSDTASVDGAGIVQQFNKLPLVSQAFGLIRGRIYYYPYFRAHSGLDGLLGYARTGNAFVAAQVYRTYSLEDFPYIPGVIGEWICTCYCTEFVPRTVGGLRFADFTLEFADTPYMFQQGVEGDYNPGAPTGDSITSRGFHLEPITSTYSRSRSTNLVIPLGQVRNAAGGLDSASWTYSLRVEERPGTLVVGYNQASRRLTVRGDGNLGPSTYIMTYFARTTAMGRPPLVQTTVIVRVV